MSSIEMVAHIYPVNPKPTQQFEDDKSPYEINKRPNK